MFQFRLFFGNEFVGFFQLMVEIAFFFIELVFLMLNIFDLFVQILFLLNHAAFHAGDFVSAFLGLLFAVVFHFKDFFFGFNNGFSFFGIRFFVSVFKDFFHFFFCRFEFGFCNAFAQHIADKKRCGGSDDHGSNRNHDGTQINTPPLQNRKKPR